MTDRIDAGPRDARGPAEAPVVVLRRALSHVESLLHRLDTSATAATEVSLAAVEPAMASTAGPEQIVADARARAAEIIAAARREAAALVDAARAEAEHIRAAAETG
jgi:cell division septum initiation protein DivIVA